MDAYTTTEDHPTIPENEGNFTIKERSGCVATVVAQPGHATGQCSLIGVASGTQHLYTHRLLSLSVVCVRREQTENGRNGYWCRDSKRKQLFHKRTALLSSLGHDY